MNDVLIIAKAFPPDLGGVETYGEQVAFAFARAGLTVDVLTQISEGPPNQVRESGKSAIRVINIGSGNQFIVFLKMARFIFGSKKKYKFVHCTTWRAGLAGCLLALRCPLILTIHGREVLQGPKRLRPLMHLVMRQAKLIITISTFTAEICRPIVSGLAKKGQVSWNGISWPTESPKADYGYDSARPFRMLFAAQLRRRKNADGAIRALANLKEKGYKIELLVAGAGPERDSLERLVRELALEDEVKLLGMVQRDKLPELYRSVDMFVHPHTHTHDSTDVETFCISVADAMAFGVPTVSGSAGAPAEYIKDHENGFLIHGERWEELAGVIETVINWPVERRQALGSSGRAFALAAFSWDRHIVPILRFAGIEAR